MTPTDYRARRRLARAATFAGVMLTLASVPLAWGPVAALGAVLLVFGAAEWVDANAELMRHEGTTRPRSRRAPDSVPLRTVGCGPFPLPGERGQRRRAYAAARRMMRQAEGTTRRARGI